MDKLIKKLLATVNKHLVLIIISIVLITAISITPTIIEKLTKHTHVYGEWELFRSPSCSVQGINQRFCECGDVQQVNIDKLEHTPGEWKVDVENNEKKLYCSVCNKVIRTESLGDHTHSYGEWITEIEATCTQGGLIARYCRCGAKEEKALKVLDHDFGEWETVKEPTCKEKGIRIRLCECGKQEEKEIPMEEHTYGSFVETKAPTCDEEGTKEMVCSKCGDIIIEDIASKGHRYGEWSVYIEATCNSSGTKRRTCHCGVFEEKIIEPTDKHSFGIWKVVIEPTINNEGKEERTCSNCGKIETKTISKLDYISDDWFITKGTLTGVNDNIEGRISIPDAVTVIGKRAFENNYNITSVSMKSSVTTIESKAFSNCVNLVSISLSSSLTEIPEKAFYSCKSLSSISLPSSVVSIGKCAFEYCISLTTIYINATTCDIDTYAFSYCTNLKSIYFAGTMNQWDKVTKQDIGINQYTVYCSDGTITIHNIEE